ncbi:MAG TPA: hemolysin family protein [Trueperaceae bacterium]|nr:hemolysin family protein [Trueperaceae bacterium]
MNEWLLLVVGLLLTVGTGIFVASEFALVNLDRAVLETRKQRGEKGMSAVIEALKRTSTHLSSAQLGITLTTLLTGYTMEPALTRLLTGPLIGAGLPGEFARPASTVVAVTVATLLSMIVGELIPKNLALALPELTARLVAPIQITFTAIFGPSVRLLNGFSNMVVRALGVEPKEELSSARTVDELSSLVMHSAEEGSLDPRAATLLTRTLDFSEYTAGDVMTPRTRLSTLTGDKTASDVIALARDTGHSRFPVTGSNVDDIVGVVHVKRALGVPRGLRHETLVADLRQEVLMAPDTLPLSALLGQLRDLSLQMALVLDEYGGTAGVVTLEDLIEELIGEVADEHDRRELGVRQAADDSWTLPGMLRLDEVAERVGLVIDEDEDYDTIGGYIMAELGKVPERGDSVSMPTGTLTVLRMDGLRVDRVRFVPTDDARKAEAEPELDDRAATEGPEDGSNAGG